MVRPVELRITVRSRRQSGFTLVELMVVVAITGVVAALAARMYSRGVRGESAPAFTRSMMATLMDARHMAVTLARPVGLTLDGSKGVVTTAAYDPNTTTWLQQSTVSLPSTMRLCTPASSAQIGSTVTPTCPFSGSNTICFWPNGRVVLITSGRCPTTSPSTASGATVYLETYAGDKNYRLVIWGLTGMVKLIDQW
jgi:type II secretion system protein H